MRLTDEIRVLGVDGEPSQMGVAVLRAVHLRVQHVLQVVRLHLFTGLDKIINISM